MRAILRSFQGRGAAICRGLAFAAASALAFTPGTAADALHAGGMTAEPPCESVEFTSPAIEKLRREQQRHLEAFNKFPDLIEVGSALWEDVWEWHVRVLQHQPALSQTAEGRYGLLFRGSLIVLRSDAPAQYLGPSIDQ